MKASALSIKNVARRYGTRSVLEGLNLIVPSGRFVAVVGRSGEGKTTLLRLLAGLDQPNSGEIRLFDNPLTGLNTSARIVFQDGRLLPWLTVLENVALGLPVEKYPNAEQLLQQVGLSDRGREWPSNLSGGQKQRVALARALAAEPALLLLDEPLGSLDSLTRREMQNLVEQLWINSGSTTILITHDVEEAVALADQVLVLEQGKVAMEIEVTLERPRRRTSTAFLEITQSILDRLLGQRQTT